MFKFLLLIFASLSIFLAPIEGYSSAEERFRYAITDLTGKLLDQQSKAHPGKTFATSAFPLLAELAVMYSYSSVETKEQILRILGLNNNDEIHSVIRNYLERFISHQDDKFRLDFKAIADLCDPFSEPFSEDLKIIIGGANLDISNPESAKNQTSASEQNRTAGTEDIITNDKKSNNSAIQFYSSHEIYINRDHPLNPKGVGNIEFKVSNTEVVKMQALCGKAFLGYAVIDELDCLAVELNVQGNNHTVVVFFPNKFEGLPKLVKWLKNPKVLYGSMDKMKPRCLSICIPLGEVSTEVDYKKYLQQIYWTNMFDPTKAKFCGVTQSRNPVYISSMKHQINLNGYSEIDENSTPTNLSSNTLSSLCPNGGDLTVTNIDRPFVYYIRDIKLNLAFMGGLYFGDS